MYLKVNVHFTSHWIFNETMALHLEILRLIQKYQPHNASTSWLKQGKIYYECRLIDSKRIINFPFSETNSLTWMHRGNLHSTNEWWSTPDFYVWNTNCSWFFFEHGPSTHVTRAMHSNEMTMMKFNWIWSLKQHISSIRQMATICVICSFLNDSDHKNVGRWHIHVIRIQYLNHGQSLE